MNRVDHALSRTLARRAFLRGAAVSTAGAAALLAAGCGGSAAKDGSSPTPAIGPTATGAGTNPGGIKPLLLANEFVANQDNRFAVGILDGSGKLLQNAAVHARFFVIGADGSTGAFRGEGDLKYTQLSLPDAHAHDRSSGSAVTDTSVSFYVANTPFDQAGKWGVEITATPQGGAPATIQAPFTVLEKSGSPGLGAMPPASRNDTVDSNPNTQRRCSRDPFCGLHDKVIGDVLGRGRPLVVQFSTPAFCQTRLCGPVLEVLLAQVPTYRDRVDFVHIEVWQDFQLLKYRPAVQEWNLPAEPYTFFIGKDGRVVAKLEAVFSGDELTSVLDQLAKL